MAAVEKQVVGAWKSGLCHMVKDAIRLGDGAREMTFMTSPVPGEKKDMATTHNV